MSMWYTHEGNDPPLAHMFRKPTRKIIFNCYPFANLLGLMQPCSHMSTYILTMSHLYLLTHVEEVIASCKL